jgi:hypothetical protein
VPLSGFRAVAICAPVSVLISDSPDGQSFYAQLSGPAAALDALTFNPTRHSLQIETKAGVDGKSFSVPGDGPPLTVELRLPPGILSYVERVHAPGDTVVTATWNPWQAEVSSSAQSGVILAGGMGLEGGASAKVSLAGPGPAVVSGPAGRWEVFAAGPGAAVHVGGPSKYVFVKVDGGAGVTVAPAGGNVTVAGWVGSAPGTRLDLGGGVGECAAHADGWVPPPGSPPGAMPPPACGVGSVSPPAVSPTWTCGVEVVGEWTCAGGGAGAVPAVRQGDCGERRGMPTVAEEKKVVSPPAAAAVESPKPAMVATQTAVVGGG